MTRRYRETDSAVVREDRPACAACSRARTATGAPAPGSAPCARGHRRRRTLHAISRATLARAWPISRAASGRRQRADIAAKVIREIALRLKFLNDVGLNYLSLDRSAETLSGGESQRIRLASQIGSGLTGVMYVLDERASDCTSAITTA